ncbi:glutathione S-transferase family protein [Prosthecodimorpha staleyi]|uniref:Glutathione S-transferase family protein n=1 Tax=Prosthecodimorpha staleyi TaxID=2840188 RepID=A0A947GAJ4_9HYPH|nr:glutathione S-transferase family protein [Prosthecodimorpha staleyi]MBT9289188.1 glutathione S-transferase family protein [Prosthecodimorpha staleyi]
MLVLRSSMPSPFGRKVKVAAALLGLSDRITIEIADTNDPSDSLRRQNPLGKIPCLVLEDGTALYDSRVILEYLDTLAGGGGIIPVETTARFAALRLQALADGLMDAALLQVYEIRFRSETERSPAWLTYQAAKVERVLAVLEEAPPAADGVLTVGEIAVACALGYLDLRFEGRWRAAHPKLVAYLDAFAARNPAFEATRVKP